jgi:hypothetical protein
MWLFLSRRVRMWLLLAVGLPLASTLVHRLSAVLQLRSPDSTAARVLNRADTALAGLARRAQRRRKR